MAESGASKFIAERRTEIRINDDCLVPDKQLLLRYTGLDPFRVAKKITESLRPFFHVSKAGWNWYRLNWDASDDPILFFSRWWVVKRYSHFSRMHIEIKVQGSVSKTTNEGQFTMTLNARIRTEWKGVGMWPLTKLAWELYSYFFYNKARMSFIENCRNSVNEFVNEVKRAYSLETGHAAAVAVG
ncbi:MAG: hypothetical protein HYX24_07395 [Candidatus Aenigmarchaeota archaeon]|nr:hypothetical protein [Candidatus Aenigmarchaeota archaeon]